MGVHRDPYGGEFKGPSIVQGTIRQQPGRFHVAGRRRRTRSGQSWWGSQSLGLSGEGHAEDRLSGIASGQDTRKIFDRLTQTIA